MGNRPRAIGVQKWPQKHTFERSKARNFQRDFLHPRVPPLSRLTGIPV